MHQTGGLQQFWGNVFSHPLEQRLFIHSGIQIIEHPGAGGIKYLVAFFTGDQREALRQVALAYTAISQE